MRTTMNAGKQEKGGRLSLGPERDRRRLLTAAATDRTARGRCDARLSDR